MENPQTKTKIREKISNFLHQYRKIFAGVFFIAMLIATIPGQSTENFQGNSFVDTDFSSSNPNDRSQTLNLKFEPSKVELVDETEQVILLRLENPEKKNIALIKGKLIYDPEQIEIIKLEALNDLFAVKSDTTKLIEPEPGEITLNYSHSLGLSDSGIDIAELSLKSIADSTRSEKIYFKTGADALIVQDIFGEISEVNTSTSEILLELRAQPQSDFFAQNLIPAELSPPIANLDPEPKSLQDSARQVFAEEATIEEVLIVDEDKTLITDTPPVLELVSGEQSTATGNLAEKDTAPDTTNIKVNTGPEFYLLLIPLLIFLGLRFYKHYA